MTKNIEDVVDERVEELFQHYDDIDCAETVDQRITAKEQAALWLERTLTQLVKEVEEREKEETMRVVMSKMRKLVDEPNEAIYLEEIEEALYELDEQTTPPTSDVTNQQT